MTPQSEFAFAALVTRDTPRPAPRARARRVFRGCLGGIDASGRWVLFPSGAVELGPENIGSSSSEQRGEVNQRNRVPAPLGQAISG